MLACHDIVLHASFSKWPEITRSPIWGKSVEQHFWKTFWPWPVNLVTSSSPQPFVWASAVPCLRKCKHFAELVPVFLCAVLNARRIVRGPLSSLFHATTLCAYQLGLWGESGWSNVKSRHYTLFNLCIMRPDNHPEPSNKQLRWRRMPLDVFADKTTFPVRCFWSIMVIIGHLIVEDPCFRGPCVKCFLILFAS